jgi:membrane-associated phospholipid phosphatase
MSTTKNLITTTIALAVLLSITASSTLDWDLSHKLVSPGSHFGEFFNRFGEMPPFVGMFISILILFGARKKEVLWRNGINHLFSIPFLALFAWVIFFMPFRYVYEFDEAGVPAAIVLLTQILAALLLVVSIVFAYKIPTHRFEPFKRLAVLIIILVIAEILVVNLTKIAWGRPRMRSLDSIDQFHYWYQIAGPAASEEFKSFPSGHTANGFLMIIFTLFIPVEKSSIIKWFTAFAITWGSCVALSRVILGAHFLSDVIVGGYIAVILFYLFKGWLIKEPNAQRVTAS